VDVSTLYIAILLSFAKPDVLAEANTITVATVENQSILASRSISLKNRYYTESVNDIYKDNILLTLSYLNGEVGKKEDINWSSVRQPKHDEFTLDPKETFAFHDQVLSEYKNIVKTTNAHFNYQDGFKSDGYLTGDGVCHLASLMYWVASDADLDTYAPTAHDFASINEIPKEYGVSIYYLPGGATLSAEQNLYITNSFSYPIKFLFDLEGDELRVSIQKSSS
jgi:hypothetical protein